MSKHHLLHDIQSLDSSALLFQPIVALLIGCSWHIRRRKRTQVAIEAAEDAADEAANEPADEPVVKRKRQKRTA